MEARCGNCRRVGDYPVREWSWVRYKGGFRDKMVCPTCRRQAEAQGCNIVSPPRFLACADEGECSLAAPIRSLASTKRILVCHAMPAESSLTGSSG